MKKLILAVVLSAVSVSAFADKSCSILATMAGKCTANVSYDTPEFNGSEHDFYVKQRDKSLRKLVLITKMTRQETAGVKSSVERAAPERASTVDCAVFAREMADRATSEIPELSDDGVDALQDVAFNSCQVKNSR